MKITFLFNEIFMDKNEIFMQEVVYSLTTHGHFWGEKIMPGSKFSFSCMKVSFSYMHESIMKISLLCMKIRKFHA